jgi:DNA-binding MarR family transcriptional regulator
MADRRKSRITRREARALGCVRQLVAALTQSARTVEQRTGITNAQLFLLRELVACDLTINELAARAETSQSTVSIVVSRLVEAGLARRARSLEDKRRAVVSITPKGRRLQNRAPEPATSRLLSALRLLPQTRLDDLESGLSALLSKMKVGSRVAPMLFEKR